MKGKPIKHTDTHKQTLNLPLFHKDCMEMIIFNISNLQQVANKCFYNRVKHLHYYFSFIDFDLCTDHKSQLLFIQL